MNIEEAIKYIKNDIEIDKDTASWFENGNIAKKQIEESIDAYETLLTAYEKEKETSHYVQSQLDIANAKLVEEKEKNKELEKRNKELNIIRLEYLVSQFPDTTETYKKYKKELDEAISNLKEE